MAHPQQVPINGRLYIVPHRAFLGSILPHWLEERPEVSPGAKIIYARLLRYAGKDAYCFPMQETLAKEIGTSERQVMRYIKELTSVELIHIQRRGLSKSNVYYFPSHPWMGNEAQALELEVTDKVVQEVTQVATQYLPNMSLPSMKRINEENQNNSVLKNGTDPSLTTSSPKKNEPTPEGKFANRAYKHYCDVIYPAENDGDKYAGAGKQDVPYLTRIVKATKNLDAKEWEKRLRRYAQSISKFHIDNGHRILDFKWNAWSDTQMGKRGESGMEERPAYMQAQHG